MYIYRDAIFWSFVDQLLKEHQFFLIDINEQHGEQEAILEDRYSSNKKRPLVLLRNQLRQYQLVRIFGTDPLQATDVIRDARLFADQLPQLAKRVRAKQLEVINIYLTTHATPDIDFDDYQIKRIESKKVRLHNFQIRLSAHETRNFSDLEDRFRDWDIEPAEFTTSVMRQSSLDTIPELKKSVKRRQLKKENEEKDIFLYGKPLYTYFFLILNIVMFFLLERHGSSTDIETLIRFGAKSNEHILAGEYWRFFTPMFLHIGLMHLLFNSMALYFLGTFIERVYGSYRFLLIYLIAGLAGTMASFAFMPHISAGASGAIFGLFGAALYFGIRYPNLFFRTLGMDIIVIVCINLVIGFAIQFIDNYGHIGGLIGGFLAAAIVSLPQKQAKIWRWISILIVLLSSAYLIMRGFK